MSIVDEPVSTIWCPHSKVHYESLGYVFTSYGKRFTVRSLELPPGSEKLVLAKCDVCGVERRIPRYAYRDLCRSCSLNKPQTKEKMSQASKRMWSDPERRRHFSVVLRQSVPRGPDSVHWKETKTWQERIRERKQPEYHQWRRSVYERDHYCCAACGYDRGGILVAHHLDSYSDFPDLRLDVSNGVTLCENCHKEFHAKFGYGHSTREQFKEFLKCKGVIVCSDKDLSNLQPRMEPTQTDTDFAAS